ncbi:MAG: substrate-binding domain-containing protein, partial [Oscillospiraceae bacterium]|nr:substrate-binding domain-containing protein [Oscillospiraceae bacterium]
ELYDILETELVGGIHETAKALGYDVLILTDTFNTISDSYNTPYIQGLESIYQLLDTASFDGVIFAAGRFHRVAMREKIAALLQEKQIPCVVLYERMEGMESVFAEHEEGVYLITKHLIEDHGFTNIAFLGGVPDHEISQQRENGYRRAMQEHGLAIDETMVFYGYYWKQVPTDIADGIADGSIAKPEAFVCANDMMAMTLMERLLEHGIRVPEDIAVTGYDGGWRAALHTPALTTVTGREKNLGIRAVCRLHEILTGEKCSIFETSQVIQHGISCGCPPLTEAAPLAMKHHVISRMELYERRKNYMASNQLSRFTGADSLEELSSQIDELAYTQFNILWLDVCLFADWTFDFRDSSRYRKDAFSEQMILLLSKRLPVNAPCMYHFPTRQILPALEKPHEPMLLVLSALHYNDQVFGYLSTAYPTVDDICLDEHYIYWCDVIAEGLNVLQMRLYTDYIHKQFDSLSVYDPETGILNRRGFLEKAARQMTCGKSYRYILFTYPNNGQTPVSMTGLIANALRKVCSQGELFCRITEQYFAVLLPERDEYPAENWIHLLHDTYLHRQETILHLIDTEPIYVTDTFLLHNMNELEHHLNIGKEKLDLRCSIRNQFPTSTQEQIEHLHFEIHSEPQQDWNLSGIAGRYHLSIGYLQRLYKERYGISIIEDVLNARMERAKWLLTHTELRITEIAEQVGFGSNAHFMRQFRSKVGVTELQYRRENRK